MATKRSVSNPIREYLQINQVFLALFLVLVSNPIREYLQIATKYQYFGFLFEK